MIRIEVILRYSKFDEVKNALSEANCHGMTITEVRGFGRQKGHKETYRGTDYTVDFVPKVSLVVFVPEAMEESVTGVIMRAAHTGQVGDGKIFITRGVELIRIRTGETGLDAY